MEAMSQLWDATWEACLPTPAVFDDGAAIAASVLGHGDDGFIGAACSSVYLSDQIRFAFAAGHRRSDFGRRRLGGLRQERLRTFDLVRGSQHR